MGRLYLRDCRSFFFGYLIILYHDLFGKKRLSFRRVLEEDFRNNSLERGGNTPFFVVCGMMLRFVGRGRGFYLGFKGVYQGLGMGMVWLLSDYWVTVRRHRPIVARLSPDHCRHFNRI